MAGSVRELSVLISSYLRVLFPRASADGVVAVFGFLLPETPMGYPASDYSRVPDTSGDMHTVCHLVLQEAATLFFLSFGQCFTRDASWLLKLLLGFGVGIAWVHYLSLSALALKAIAAHAMLPLAQSPGDGAFRLAAAGVILGSTMICLAWCAGMHVFKSIAALVTVLPFGEEQNARQRADVLFASHKAWSALAVAPAAICGGAVLVSSLFRVGDIMRGL